MLKIEVFNALQTWFGPSKYTSLKSTFKTQPQIENKDVAWSPRYNLPTTRTNKCRALSLQEVELDGWFFILHICTGNTYHTIHAQVQYSLRFKKKVTFGHKLRYKIKATFGEISLKLRQTNWNVAKNNANVVVDELPRQITICTCLTIDIWTQWRRCTSTQFYGLMWHLPKLAGFEWNWRQNFSTLLWTPPVHPEALSESYATHTVLC